MHRRAGEWSPATKAARMDRKGTVFLGLTMVVFCYLLASTTSSCRWGVQNSLNAPSTSRSVLEQELVPSFAQLSLDEEEEQQAAGVVPPRISTTVQLSTVAVNDDPEFRLSDPSIVFFEGYYIAAFTEGPTRARLAVSPDGVTWTLCSIKLNNFQWTSLFVYHGKLYLIGPEGLLWKRRDTTNDLQIAHLGFDAPDKIRLNRRTKLTENMGIHILNNVPVIVNDTIFFPMMIAPASTKWEPISIEGFATVQPSMLEQGMHAVETSEGEVQLQAWDWDASVFGVVVEKHNFGRNAFIRFEEGAMVFFARIVGVEGNTLWVVPQRWDADCSKEEKDWACKSSVTHAGGALTLTSKGALWPDSPIFQEFILTVMQTAGPDILDPAAWKMSPFVGNPVMRYPQAHKLWVGPSIQERTVDGTIRQCTGTGKRECVYWQEPVAFASREGVSVNVAVRFTNDQNCNSALLCSLADGALECDTYAPVPGFGNVRGYVFYDEQTRLYWAVNNFNIDASADTGRVGQRCMNQRGNMGLFYSGDMHNWVLAKVLSKSSHNRLALLYVSCTVETTDLMCVARTNGQLEDNFLVDPTRHPHNSRLVVSFRVPHFRTLLQ